MAPISILARCSLFLDDGVRMDLRDLAIGRRWNVAGIEVAGRCASGEIRVPRTIMEYLHTIARSIRVLSVEPEDQIATLKTAKHLHQATNHSIIWMPVCRYYPSLTDANTDVITGVAVDEKRDGSNASL
jgi:hypothetical protein